MVDSEDSKSNFKKIFISSTIRTKNKTKIIPNTAQNIYINQNTNSKASNEQNGGKIKLIPSLSKNKNDNNNDNDNDDDNDDETDDDDDETDDDNDYVTEISSENEVDSNDEPMDEYENKEQLDEISSDIELKKDNEDNIINTEYNEDGIAEKNTINNDEENEEDDCLYQYDDLISDKDLYQQPYEVPHSERMTDPQMTHYEKVRILGIRSKQIAMGSKVMVKYDNLIGPIELAKYELQNKTTPLIIKRPLPDNSYELWKVSELNINDDNSQIIKQDLKDSFIANKDNIYTINPK
jgi:DNA-directed RNA polymerase I, II, and III subunit RPABC2